jgi:hypothetical protein
VGDEKGGFENDLADDASPIADKILMGFWLLSGHFAPQGNKVVRIDEAITTLFTLHQLSLLA